MPMPPNGMHLCPTRVDGAPVLFAHAVTHAMCQDRQRGRYHKCFMCAHNNARSEEPKLALTALPKLALASKATAG